MNLWWPSSFKPLHKVSLWKLWLTLCRAAWPWTGRYLPLSAPSVLGLQDSPPCWLPLQYFHWSSNFGSFVYPPCNCFSGENSNFYWLFFLYFNSQLLIHVFLMATISMSGISDHFPSFLKRTWLHFHDRPSLNNTSIWIIWRLLALFTLPHGSFRKHFS